MFELVQFCELVTSQNRPHQTLGTLFGHFCELVQCQSNVSSTSEQALSDILDTFVSQSNFCELVQFLSQSNFVSLSNLRIYPVKYLEHFLASFVLVQQMLVQCLTDLVKHLECFQAKFWNLISHCEHATVMGVKWLKNWSRRNTNSRRFSISAIFVIPHKSGPF